MSIDFHAHMRSCARQIFDHALQDSSVDAAFDRHVEYGRGVLRVGEDLFELNSYSRIFVVSIGKAGHTMAKALVDRIGTLASGIIAVPHPVEPQLSGFRYFAGGHPLPNAESVRAADAILKSLGKLPAPALVIYLLSGGGSSIVEKPIDDEISLNDLKETYRVLVQSGAPIAQMNAIRKHISRVKGGRMAAAAGLARQVSILVSDVPDDSLDALASGPTMPDTTSVEDCYRIAGEFGMVERFPASVRELFTSRALEETPDADDPLFHYSRWWPVLSNVSAVKAAATKAAELGFAVEIDNSCDDQDYTRAAKHLLDRLRQLRQGASKVCLISGGEVTVKITGDPGIGGRNQQFALYCAARIAQENIVVLSAGTDGMDGNSEAAGALADGTTLERLVPHANAEEALRTFNSFPAFHAIGDAILTGPTGNNLRDLRILLAY